MDLSSDFPAFIVVTGTAYVRGGETTKTGEDGTTTKITLPARRQANSIASKYATRIKSMSVVKLPFGYILATEALPKLKQMIKELDEVIRAFNIGDNREDCVVWNCVIWEPLRGNRLAAVRAWMAAHPEDAQKIEAA